MRPSQPNQTPHMDATTAWISVHAPGGLMVWPPVFEPTGGAYKLAAIRYSGQSVAWTIRKVVHLCWTIRLVDNPQVGKPTIPRNSYGPMTFYNVYYRRLS